LTLAADLWLWEDFFLKSMGTWSSRPRFVIMILFCKPNVFRSATVFTHVFTLPCRLYKYRLYIDLTSYQANDFRRKTQQLASVTTWRLYCPSGTSKTYIKHAHISFITILREWFEMVSTPELKLCCDKCYEPQNSIAFVTGRFTMLRAIIGSSNLLRYFPIRKERPSRRQVKWDISFFIK
jgi:hypothetical protein